ncbi:hypothetical protein PybrP1_000798 [[Pythium] brassicae (nom. inval.)]|nr:hypothetical protein PybrP1_000798 [[Pythium] brassicae (nom. inval.)]
MNASFEDVEFIVQWVRERIALPGYQPRAWTAADLATVKEFAENTATPALFLSLAGGSGSRNDAASAGGGALVVSTSAPRGAAPEPLMYFVKNGAITLSPATIKDALQFGTVEKDATAALLHLLNGYYLQRLQANRAWPESVQKEFTGQFFRFMSSLTETVSRGCGKTVLYLPPVNPDKFNHKDKDLVQQLESTVIHWTRQIKEVINNQDNAHDAEGAGPLEEIKFWEHRTQDLSGITDQLNRQGVKEIVEILRAAKSSYLQPFETLSQIIKQGSVEANDNLLFLKKLSPVCEDIARAQPDEIPLLLPKLLHLVRLIWTYSRHYNTEDRITSLLRKVSNEIIVVCCKKVALPDIFDGNVEASITHLEQSIQCGVAWKRIYHTASSAVNASAPAPDRRWAFDETGIFAQIDAFVQRCRELLEVCEGQIQFARKGKDGKRAALPAFGGNRGLEIVKSLRGIEAQFEGHVERLRRLDYDILDVKITSWHGDFNAFKNGMKDLEAMTQNVINGAFESVAMIAAGVDLILAFRTIAQREAIKRCVEKRTIDIFGMFKASIATLRNLFEKNKGAPPLSATEPQFAGSALWARSLLLRATDDLVRLQELADASNAAENDEAQASYDGLRLVVNEYIQRKYHDWIEDLNALGSTNMSSRLESPLMTKTGLAPDQPIGAAIGASQKGAPDPGAAVNLNALSHGKDSNVLQNTEKSLIGRAKKGFLSCNFDRPLLNLFAEVHYWQFFSGEIQIPYMAHDICNQKEQLRVLREHVMLVVRDYNRILLDLSSTERRLFEDIIRKLDRRIQPGLQKLTWVSKGIVEWYVADCRKHCEATYKVVQEFQENKDIVLKNCKMIGALMHIFIERNTVYDEGVFEAKQDAHRKEIERQLRDAYLTISSTMAATFQHFAAGPPEVLREWNRFVERCDKMLEDALRQSVKKSLQELSKAINGDAKTDPRPLFRIHVVLEDSKVEFKPFMVDLTHMVNTVAKEVFNVISVVPRLVSSLQQQQQRSVTNQAPSDGNPASASLDHVSAADEVDKGVASADASGDANNQVAETTRVGDEAVAANTFYQSIFNDEEILKVLVHIMNGMSSSATELQKYLGYWDKYKLLWNQDKQAFIRRYAKANRPLQQFRADIERYREQQTSIQNEDLTNTINFIQIDTNYLKTSLIEHTVQWIGKLTGLLNQTAHDELRDLMAMMRDNSKKLQVKPSSLDHLGESIRLLHEIRENVTSVTARFEPLQAKYELLAEFDVQTTDDEQRDLANLKTHWEAYEAMLVDANAMLQKSKTSMKQNLQDSVAELNALMADLRAEAEASLPYSGDQLPAAAQRILHEFEKKMETTRARQSALKKGLEIFGIDESRNEGFAQTEKELELLQQIWALTDEWEGVWASWKNKVFYEIEVESLESTAAQFFKKVVKYGKEMKNWTVWSSMKSKIEQFRQTLPLIQDLKSPALRARHWAQLKDEMGKSFDTESASFTLERVFSLGFHLHAEFISTLSGNAGKELSIEQALDGIEKRWDEIEIDIGEYKAVYYKIKSADDLFTALEDDQVQLSTMKASPFFGSFATKILYWEKTLSHMSEVVETLLSVQRCWIYLESIFMASEDIRKQLPLESKLFDEVNAAYCKVTEAMAKTRNAVRATQEPRVLDMLLGMQEKLDQIQKCLDQYLETKRMLFPRFYFLSNDDLLEILGHQKDPDQVQKHIKKCFEAIKTLTLVPPGVRGNATFEALGMNSPCGEQVLFASNVVVAGAVEGWLLRVEAAMVSTLEKVYAQCLVGYKGKKEKWIKDFPGQLLITCGQTAWTNECIKALNEVAKGEKKALRQLKKKWVSYLNKLADMVRGQLSATDRKKVVALITIEIHSRDVVDRLVKQSCKSVNDFDWLMQLRFYFNKDLGESGICEGTIEQELAEQKLQVHAGIVFKTIQLYESQVTRHCNMIVGQTMAGKSTIWKTLQLAKTCLAKNGTPGYMPVRVQPEERELLQALFDKYVEKLLRFKQAEGSELIPVTEFNSVKSFCNLYNALGTKENGVDRAACGDKFGAVVEKWFLFCVTWSVLGAADEDGRKKFDSCLRDIDTVYPPLKTVYDFYVDAAAHEFKLWDEKLPQNFRIAPNTAFHKILVPTIDTLRYGFLLQTMLGAGIHTLVVGETGVGKTTVVQKETEGLSDAYQCLVLYFSSATSSATTQDVIETVMEKRSLNRFGPVGGKKLVTFIDDLNMPAKDTFGSQPPLELLRQWMDYSCWYDRKKQSLKYFVDMQIVASMGPPGGGRSVISSRFQSRFNLVNMTIPEHAQLKRIFETMLVPKLAEFDDEVKPLGAPLVAATIQLYQSVLELFLPTPANCHYLFNLRDMAKVIQGLLLSDKHNVTSRDNALRLWVHEALRVFSDRLTSGDDQQLFKKKVDELLGAHFQSDWGRLLGAAPERLKESGPLFTYVFSSGAGEGASAPPKYVECLDMKVLKTFIEEQLENHNAEPGYIPMNLVMFGDALLHILRIHRQLMTARGNLLLVGVGGSGRQSLTRLAAFIGGFKVLQIEVVKNYRASEFHDDIKKLYEQVGVQEQKTVFLFSDTQIKSESFVEDLNNILSSGEIPGLFDKEEQPTILDAVRLRARAQGVKETKEALWSFFISEVRRNLHVVLAFSPIGKGFRNRMRQFPSLVNNTTIDWFSEWPLDALQEVAMKFLEEKSVASDKQRPKIASVFAVVHSSVLLASGQVLASMKRHNYVTPTNYLSLVTGYVDLLSEKSAAIRDTRDKLKNGLAKLEESRLQVEDMSKQLEERKLVVAQKNKDCSDLLVVIVSERRVADEQRKQVEADSERISKEEAETQKIADDAQKDLDEALPALQRAMLEVENLDKKAIAEVKVYSQPPELVSLVMCAVMILFGLQPTWATAKTKMNDVNFLQQIKTFDKDSIRDKTVKELKKYTAKPLFNADVVRKVSSAAGALCAWVLAMECYSGVFKVVAPKKEILKRSQQALELKQKDFKLATAKLHEVTEKVEGLKQQYDASVAEKNALREEAESLELKLSRAEQLVKGLAGERERWQVSIAQKNDNLVNVVGDALVAAAFISYAGPFDSVFRGSLVDTWMNRVVDPMMKDLLRKLENGIRFGTPVLMQDILEELDPSLEPILNKSIIRIGNREVLRLGDKELDYNRAFRFYLTTKLHNPHYTPEVSTKTTIVNFVVKEQGLEAQLLGITVQLEEPALEEQKSDLVVRVAAAKKKLIDLENEILRLLSAAKGSLLDDESLVTTLNASKTTSEEVTSQLLISEETEKKIDVARMGYAKVALRSSTLYFVLNDMTSVDPMYQFSLDSYVSLFKDSIVKSRSLKSQGALSEELTERINAINDYHTYAVYAYACRGLFERHKLLFSLQMCIRVLQSVGKMPQDEYEFLLKGGSSLAQDDRVANYASEFLPDQAWGGIVELNKLARFHGLVSSFEQAAKAWKGWYQSSTPELEPLPGDWDVKCNDLQRMLLLRCVRPDRLSIQAARFTAANLGAQFVDPPPFDLKAIYETSNYRTPLVFVLSPGVDPTNSLIALADSLHKKVENCALGQGQASIAEAMMQRGLEAGNWVFLANCHLMLSWAPALEKLIDTFCSPAAQVNPHFRLWLSSDPNPNFPIAILQRGIKMTTEPPRGLKANLLRLYNTVSPDRFGRCRQAKKYKRLLFCLCWFHSLLLERRKFNNLGWNIPYDFNESDFAISEDVLAIYLDEYDETPWDALKYLIAQANYGGRVTDDWDRRLMLVYINQFFAEDVLQVENVPLSDSEYYFVPDDGDLHAYAEYIRQLPLDDPPAAFGQHPNAQIASQIDDGRELVATMLSLQAMGVAEGGKGSDEKVLSLLQSLKESVPEVFDLASVKAALAARSDPDALKTVLVQELERYNKLLATIRGSVVALEKGIQGSVVITPELEAVYVALLLGSVPKAWSFCYPSLKPLGPWTQDLKLRCEQMTKWANHAVPSVFWLSGFTYPTGFLTALLQTAARKNGISIDSLNWDFVVINQNENALAAGPKDGAYIKGLILEGARWDFDHDCLTEPLPMELNSGMPILHFKPVESKKKASKGLYSCPLYMYPLRTGTRERPSFMIAVDLKSGAGKSPDIWTRRGTALLLSLAT